MVLKRARSIRLNQGPSCVKGSNLRQIGGSRIRLLSSFISRAMLAAARWVKIRNGDERQRKPDVKEKKKGGNQYVDTCSMRTRGSHGRQRQRKMFRLRPGSVRTDFAQISRSDEMKKTGLSRMLEMPCLFYLFFYLATCVVRKIGSVIWPIWSCSSSMPSM
jgi:hypothetical protein